MILLLIALLFLPVAASAEGNSFGDGLLKYSACGQSLLADVHPNFVRFDVAFMTNHQEWDWGQTGKPLRFNTYGTMGINLPLWSGETKEKKDFLSLMM